MKKEIVKMENVYVGLVIMEKHVRNSIALINVVLMVIVIISKEDVCVIQDLKVFNVKFQLVLITVMVMDSVCRMPSVSVIPTI